MFNKIKKILNNKGFFSIEFTIVMLIIAAVIAFMVDMTVIGVQRASMSRQLQDLVSVVERQSGIEREMPIGFSGQENTYYTPTGFMSVLNSMKEKNNLESLKVTINGREVTDRTEFFFNHKETFEMEMSYVASWGFLSKVVPGVMDKQTYTHKAIGFTEFRGNYDNWGGE